MKQNKYDIIVVGAGVAGGVFALSQPESTKILVIERDISEPDRIIGELLQPGGVLALEKMQLGHLLENIDAQVVNGYCLIKENQYFTIRYDQVQNGVNGIGLRNGKFLTNIRNEINKRPNIDLIEGNVIQILTEDNIIQGVKYQKNNQDIYSEFANLTVVCDGPMSILREQLSVVNKEVTSFFIGLIIKDLSLNNPSYGHMILTGKSPILVYPIQNNQYRMLIDYPGKKAPRIGKKSIEQLKEKILQDLPEEMKKSFLESIEQEPLKVMPNHSMRGQAFHRKGGVLLGDSLNMRHPLTGGGMTAVFSDIICLNEKLNQIDIQNIDQLETAIQHFYIDRKKGVETINILADALYGVFMDKDLKEACFEYLQKGGEQAKGPISILSGINKNKKELLKHFYKVPMQHPIHFITRPVKQIRLYKNAYKIIRSILKAEDVPAML